MQPDTFVNFNGNIIKSDQPIFTASNRAFRYGDALFETIRLMNGEILYFEKHLKRLQRSMELLGMLPHDELTFHNLYLSFRHLDQVNNLKGNGRLRLEVFRNDGGLYTPHTNEVSYLIEAFPLNGLNYTMNDNGISIGIFRDIQKPPSRLSNLKSSNALYYVMAGLFNRRTGGGDCLVLNTHGRIAEAISSNVFLVKSGKVYTPSLAEACVSGIMRETLIEFLRTKNTEVIETGIEESDLLEADEIFLTDVIHGIRWVSAFRQKRYFNKFSRKLLEQLQELNDIKKA